jgi:hypothetical protein
MTDDETPTVYYPFSVLRELEHDPVADVVTLLEDTLRRARDGEVIGVAIAMACAGRCDATAYAVGDGNIAALVLACARLKVRLLSVGEEEP